MGCENPEGYIVNSFPNKRDLREHTAILDIIGALKMRRKKIVSNNMYKFSNIAMAVVDISLLLPI